MCRNCSISRKRRCCTPHRPYTMRGSCATPSVMPSSVTRSHRSFIHIAHRCRSRTLKPAAVAAFKRIFRIIDKDGDGGAVCTLHRGPCTAGLLSDDELNGFQALCFKQSLSKEEIIGVKSVRVVR